MTEHWVRERQIDVLLEVERMLQVMADYWRSQLVPEDPDNRMADHYLDAYLCALHNVQHIRAVYALALHRERTGARV